MQNKFKVVKEIINIFLKDSKDNKIFREIS